MKTLLPTWILACCFLCLPILMLSQTATSPRILWYQANSGSRTQMSQNWWELFDNYAKASNVELVQISDPTGIERSGFLEAFSLLIVDDASMEQFLSVEQQAAIQRWLTSGHGALLRYGKGEMPMASTSRSGMDQASRWAWYQELIQATLTSVAEPAEAWAGTNIPNLRVGSEPLQPSATDQSLFACANLETKVIALALPSYWELSEEPHLSPLASPVLQQQISHGLDWGLGLRDLPPVAIQYVEVSQYGARKPIELQWHTDFEVLHDHFELRKASPMGDFTQLEEIPAMGESSDPNEYFFFEREAFASFQLYQLRMHSQVGEVAESPILLISGWNAGPMVSLFPNPVQRELHVQVGLTEADSYELTIENEKGTEMLTQKIQMQYQEQKQILDLRELGPGMYRVKISSEEGESMHAFVKH